MSRVTLGHHTMHIPRHIFHTHVLPFSQLCQSRWCALVSILGPRPRTPKRYLTAAEQTVKLALTRNKPEIVVGKWALLPSTRESGRSMSTGPKFRTEFLFFLFVTGTALQNQVISIRICELRRRLSGGLSSKRTKSSDPKNQIEAAARSPSSPVPELITSLVLMDSLGIWKARMTYVHCIGRHTCGVLVILVLD